jgi:cyclic pyranopterin monophosphate synthase
MRDISAKIDTLRTATARAVLLMSPSTYETILRKEVPKGDPLEVSKVAAIMAAKNTPLILPYCHPVPVDFVGVDFDLQPESIVVDVTVKAVYRTGVEMEALAGAAAAVLNLYDMLKMLDDHMSVSKIELLEKKGGKSDFTVPDRAKAAVIVVSDSVAKKEAEDRSGYLLVKRLEPHCEVVKFQAIPDGEDTVRAVVLQLAEEKLDLVVTTGGTGLGPRDLTPEAVLPILEARLEGVEEAIKSFGQKRMPYAMLSRVVAGRIGRSLVLCLPGSIGGVADAMDAIFPHLLHALHVMQGGGHD